MTGQALQMQFELQRLQQRHGTAPPDTSLIPFAPATDGPMVLHGFAATSDIDADRQRIRPYALAWLPWQLPPLLFKHDAAVVAGSIDALEYDGGGNLTISATVSHPVARRCNHFSVGITVLAFKIVHADRPDFHANILQARLDEVSLTDRPANRNAIVAARHVSLQFDITRLAKVATLMKEAMS